LNASADNSEDLAAAHRILGQVLHQMNRLQESRKELEAAVALEPSYASEYDLAVVCLDLDDEQCAVHNFDGVEASSGDRPALHMQFGLAYGNSDFAPRAVTEFKKALAENPRYPGAHYGVAAALLAGGEDEKTLEEAAAELKEELAIFPNDFLSYAALGKIEAGYHKYPESQESRRLSLPGTNVLRYAANSRGRSRSSPGHPTDGRRCAEPLSNSEGAFPAGQDTDAGAQRAGSARGDADRTPPGRQCAVEG
jgi:tetratricopeptide (TPR) repeat protein